MYLAASREGGKWKGLRREGRERERFEEKGGRRRLGAYTCSTSWCKTN